MSHRKKEEGKGMLFSKKSRDIAQLLRQVNALSQTDEVKKLTEVISNGDEISMSELAQKRNKDKELYCTECCTSFRLKSGGTWKSGGKKADLVAGRMLVCTCGTVVGIIIARIPAIGEVVATH